ncbi:MAG: helix-hairpin-helix domain-containing protein [Gemmatimonadaceae bacterium]
MPTAAERQALAFLAGVALLGGGVRVWQQRHNAGTESASVAFKAGAEGVDGQLSAIDAARASKRGKKAAGKPKRATSKSKGETRTDARAIESRPVIIDVDIASAQELEKLPRVGMALAERIVANRDSLGAFGSLEALGSVRGIGVALLKVLDPLITFSGRPRANASNENVSRDGRRKRARKLV